MHFWGCFHIICFHIITPAVQNIMESMEIPGPPNSQNPSHPYYSHLTPNPESSKVCEWSGSRGHGVRGSHYRASLEKSLMEWWWSSILPFDVYRRCSWRTFSRWPGLCESFGSKVRKKNGRVSWVVYKNGPPFIGLLTLTSRGPSCRDWWWKKLICTVEV